MDTRTNATRNRPHFDPVRQEWSLRTGPNTWLVWKHGTRPGDDERLQPETEKERAREQAEVATS
jgi:hypothetical protein